ncbi:MAG: transketolase C-terminal domain-containing protein [Kiritimatiellia bacterium]
MRKEFAAWMENHGVAHAEVVFITGDLGFMALENVQRALGKRFVNAGVSEQNMISLAAGMAEQGLKPFCYSIAPFIVFRPVEQIRLDVGLHNLNVKMIGNGGGYGYGIMGATHHAIEDFAVLSALPNVRCFVPYSNEDVAGVCNAMQAFAGPAYLRLGFGQTPAGVDTAQTYAPVRRLLAGEQCTVVGIGSVIINAVSAVQALGAKAADVFVVSELPVVAWGAEVKASIQRTGKLMVLEEHVARGGLGEHLAAWMLHNGLSARWVHRHAAGYPNGRYGSQAYHQIQSGLDAVALQMSLRELIHG